MPAREKIIQHFEDAIEASGNNNKWRFVRVDIINDALKLLKSDQTYLQNLTEILQDIADIIRELPEDWRADDE